MEIKEINEKVNSLVALRATVNALKERVAKKQLEFEESIAKEKDAVSKMQEDRDVLQREILTALQGEGLDSWRVKGVATVSVKPNITYSVVDMDLVIAKLKKMKLDKEYLKVSVTASAKEVFALQFKKKGEFPGVEMIDKPFISILSVKK